MLTPFRRVVLERNDLISSNENTLIDISRSMFVYWVDGPNRLLVKREKWPNNNLNLGNKF
jgi:hypothetical protein